MRSDQNLDSEGNYLFSGFNSATTHRTIPTLLLIAPPKTCHATAETKVFENPYPMHAIPECRQKAD